MTRTAENKKKIEQEKNGLVIVSACYGLGAGAGERGELDVTVPLQFFVQDSKLWLGRGSKNCVLGFFSSAEGQEVASLYVRYTSDGVLFETTISDSDDLLLPSRTATAIGDSQLVR